MMMSIEFYTAGLSFELACITAFSLYDICVLYPFDSL